MKLVPFSGSPSFVEGLQVEARIEVHPKGFFLLFEMTGPAVERILCAGKKDHPERQDGLWKSTCFEAFFSVAHSEAYFEFNGSPSGDWALYEFDGYRKGGKNVDSGSAPSLEVFEKGKDRIFCSWRIPFFTPKVLEKAGITAVLENDGSPGEVSYWALKHAGAKPDFHLKESFIHHLL